MYYIISARKRIMRVLRLAVTDQEAILDYVRYCLVRYGAHRVERWRYNARLYSVVAEPGLSGGEEEKCSEVKMSILVLRSLAESLSVKE